jgi:hypothetical protein
MKATGGSTAGSGARLPSAGAGVAAGLGKFAVVPGGGLSFGATALVVAQAAVRTASKVSDNRVM